MNWKMNHENDNSMNKKKMIAILASLIIMISAFSSVLFVAVEANHKCSGQDCPICVSMHEAEETIRNLGMAVAGGLIFVILPALLLLAVFVELHLVPVYTLITQKVRLNN